MVHDVFAGTLPPHVVEEIAKSAALAPVMLMAPRVILLLNRFLKVAIFDALVFPTTVLAKRTFSGISLIAATPVPVRVTDCGLLVALSVNVKEALLAPVAVGANATPIVQEELAAMVVPQVLDEIAKSPGLAPVKPTLDTVTATVLLLVTVTIFAALVVVKCVFGNSNEEGETVKGPLPPLPTEMEAEAVTALLTVSVTVTD